MALPFPSMSEAYHYLFRDSLTGDLFINPVSVSALNGVIYLDCLVLNMSDNLFEDSLKAWGKMLILASDFVEANYYPVAKIDDVRNTIGELAPLKSKLFFIQGFNQLGGNNGE